MVPFCGVEKMATTKTITRLDEAFSDVRAWAIDAARDDAARGLTEPSKIRCPGLGTIGKEQWDAAYIEAFKHAIGIEKN